MVTAPFVLYELVDVKDMCLLRPVCIAQNALLQFSVCFPWKCFVEINATRALKAGKTFATPSDQFF